MAYGKLSGRVGIVVNLCLCTIKLVLGLFSGAVSVVADAIHNLADAAASLVTLLGFRLSAKPADEEHPFGHGRVEYIAGLVIAGAILMIGAKLLETSVEKILEPAELSADGSTIFILIATVVFQLWLGNFNMRLGERIDSAAVKAAATDSLSDCIATVFVVVSLGLHYLFAINVDGYAGLIVAAFILHSGWDAAQETLQPLLGKPPSETLVREIQETVLADPAIQDMHDLLIHDYGPGRIYASLHAEVPAHMDIMEAHAAIDAIEEKLRRKFRMQVTVHMDPVVVDDPETNRLRAEVERIVQEEEVGSSIHDFRVTSLRDGGKKLIFDIAVPPSNKMQDKDIRYFVTRRIKQLNKHHEAVIRIDRFYASS